MCIVFGFFGGILAGMVEYNNKQNSIQAMAAKKVQEEMGIDANSKLPVLNGLSQKGIYLEILL